MALPTPERCSRNLRKLALGVEGALSWSMASRSLRSETVGRVLGSPRPPPEPSLRTAGPALFARANRKPGAGTRGGACGRGVAKGTPRAGRIARPRASQVGAGRSACLVGGLLRCGNTAPGKRTKWEVVTFRGAEIAGGPEKYTGALVYDRNCGSLLVRSSFTLRERSRCAECRGGAAR